MGNDTYAPRLLRSWVCGNRPPTAAVAMSVFPLSLCRLASLRGAVPVGDDICIDVPASNPAALALAEDAGMVKVFEVSPRLSTLHPELRTANFKP